MITFARRQIGLITVPSSAVVSFRRVSVCYLAVYFLIGGLSGSAAHAAEESAQSPVAPTHPPLDSVARATRRLISLGEYIQQLKTVEMERGPQFRRPWNVSVAMTDLDRIGDFAPNGRLLGSRVIAATRGPKDHTLWLYVMDKGGGISRVAAQVHMVDVGAIQLEEILGELNRSQRFYAALGLVGRQRGRATLALSGQLPQVGGYDAEVSSRSVEELREALATVQEGGGEDEQLEAQVRQALRSSVYQKGYRSYEQLMAIWLLQVSDYWWDGGGDPWEAFAGADGHLDDQRLVHYASQRFFGSRQMVQTLGAQGVSLALQGADGEVSRAEEVLPQDLQREQEPLESVVLYDRERVGPAGVGGVELLDRAVFSGVGGASVGFDGSEGAQGAVGGAVVRGAVVVGGRSRWRDGDLFAERSSEQGAGLPHRSVRGALFREMEAVDVIDRLALGESDVARDERRLEVRQRMLEADASLPLHSLTVDLFADGSEGRQEVQVTRSLAVAGVADEVAQQAQTLARGIVGPARDRYRHRVLAAERRLLGAARQWAAIKAAAHGIDDGAAIEAFGALPLDSEVVAWPGTPSLGERVAARRAAQEIQRAHRFLSRSQEKALGAYRQETQPYYTAMASRLLEVSGWWQEAGEPRAVFAGADGALDDAEQRRLVRYAMERLAQQSGAASGGEMQQWQFFEREASMLRKGLLGPAHVRLLDRVQSDENRFWVMVLRGVSVSDTMESMVVRSEGG